jgi:hypothetical protein
MRKRTAANVGGGLLTLVWPFWRPVLDLIGLAGVPGDLQTWRGVMGDWSWALAVVGIAIILWANWEQLKDRFKPRDKGDGSDQPPSQGPNSSAGSTYNVHNSGSGFALGHGVINLATRPRRFEMTEAVMAEIASKLDRTRPTDIAWRNKPRQTAMAEALQKYLTAQGFEAKLAMGIGTITGVEFDQPVTISASGFQFGGVTLLGGRQCVAIEAVD